MKKCIIYARCSTKDQETANQLAQLRDYACKQGWEVHSEVVDVCSGSKGAGERDGLDKVFKLAHPQSKHVFVNPDGRPYTRDVFRQRLNRWCARAGIPERPPYALRHFFGTTQASGGTNLAIIAQLMGHSQIQTTTRYIANVAVVHQQAAALMQQHLAGLIAPPNIPATQPNSASSPPEPST